jgi:hypothetical protein
MTAADVIERLRLRFAAPRHALFVEVGNATGFGANRHIDALAIGLWPSEGMLVEGIEVKVSRSDWLRERKNPAKAHAIARYCDRFWLAVPDAAIVRPGELPERWGILECTEAACGVRVRVQAQPLEAEPLTRTFVAAIARASHRCAPAVKVVADAARDAERRLQRERDEARRAPLPREDEG